MQIVLTRKLTVAIILLFVVGALISGGQSAKQATIQTQPSVQVRSGAGGYVLRADEGEVLQRGKGNTVTIKVDPKTGSPNMALGTQNLEAGSGIPVHMHEQEDEVLFVHEGGGVAVLGDQRKIIGKGDTVYIPHGVWHGVETKDTGINLLWVVTPPGLEEFFRAVSSPLGTPPKVLTPAQIEDIGHKHGLRFKPH